MRTMANTFSTLARWAPGPKSCGALAEATKWRVWPGAEDRGIDGDTALRAWNKGTVDVDTACNIARLCVDSSALDKLLKDRRVAVRKTVLANPNCSWDTLASKIGWAETIDKSLTVRNLARRTLETALHRAPFGDVLEWLRDGLALIVFDLAARHPNISDSEIVTFANSTWTGPDGAACEGDSFAARVNLRNYTDETLCTLSDISNKLRVSVAAMAAKQGRETVTQHILDNTSAENARQIAGHMADSRNMSAQFYERLHAIYERSTTGHTSSPATFVTNPHSPWRLWSDYKMDQTLVNAFGKALAENWGDNPIAWRVGADLVATLPDSTLAELVGCVEALCPSSE